MGITHKSQEDDKMKTLNLTYIALVLLTAGCASSGAVYDDVYYSRNGNATPASGKQEKLAEANPTKTYTSATVKSSSNYDYETYYQDDAAQTVNTVPAEPVYQTSETVTETDGTTYTTTETYYDSDYASRIRRFGSGSSSNFGYYDSYNTGCYSCGGSNFYLGVGYPYGWSFGFSYGYPYYGSRYYSPFYRPYYGYGWGGYYDPFFYDPWYAWGPSWGWGGSYWMGYNHGYWNGYYDGGWGYPDYGRSRRYYGHRSGLAGGSPHSSGSARGVRNGDDKEDTYVSSRGTRVGSAATGGSAVIDKTTSARGSNSGYTRGTAEQKTAADRQARSERPANRIERPQQTNDRGTTPATTRESRPSANEKVNEYRNRYQRPTSSTAAPSEKRYERPKTYSSPSDRQPRSSSEYVRPQRDARSVTTSPSTRSTYQSRPSGTRQSPTYSSPSRSTNTPSYSTPSRSTSSPTRSSSGTISRSSSGSSSSGSTSRGSSSSSGSSSRGGRR